MIKYNWMDAEIVGTPSILSTKMTISTTDIMVRDPSDWSVLLVDLKRRTWSSHDGCSIPFYECLFTRLGMRMPYLNLRWPS